MKVSALDKKIQQSFAKGAYIPRTAAPAGVLRAGSIIFLIGAVCATAEVYHQEKTRSAFKDDPMITFEDQFEVFNMNLHSHAALSRPMEMVSLTAVPFVCILSARSR